MTSDDPEYSLALPHLLIISEISVIRGQVRQGEERR